MATETQLEQWCEADWAANPNRQVQAKQRPESEDMQDYMHGQLMNWAAGPNRQVQAKQRPESEDMQNYTHGQLMKLQVTQFWQILDEDEVQVNQCWQILDGDLMNENQFWQILGEEVQSTTSRMKLVANRRSSE